MHNYKVLEYGPRHPTSNVECQSNLLQMLSLSLANRTPYTNNHSTRNSTNLNFSNVGQRLTQHKGAIVTIQKFRLVSTPIPLAGGGQTAQPSLAFECSSVSILGSSGEATFGNPFPIGSLTDITSWANGPDRMGEKIHPSPYRGHSALQNPPKITPLQEKVPSGTVSDKVLPKTTSFSTTPSRPIDVGDNLPNVQIPLTKNGTHDLKSYTATWQVRTANIIYVLDAHKTKLVTKSRKFDINSIASGKISDIT